MKMLVDTREQRPLSFPTDGIVRDVATLTLPVGDYWCEYQYPDGSTARPPLIFERKGLQDLFSTMAGGYPRFKREVLRAHDLNLQLVLIIEGTLTEVYQGVPRSKLDGDSCAMKLFTLWAKYGLLPVFCSSRREMATYIRETYIGLGRWWTPSHA